MHSRSGSFGDANPKATQMNLTGFDWMNLNSNLKSSGTCREMESPEFSQRDSVTGCFSD